MVRAWVGGFGYAKVGANYGPSLLATQEARKRGFGQVLWLYGPEGYCTEAGASNFFVVWRCPATGKTQLVTAPLDDRLILDGVTRRSLLQLARERFAGEVEVVERRYTIDDVLLAEREGRLVEAFAAGTAVSLASQRSPLHPVRIILDAGRVMLTCDFVQYFVCPVSLVHHRGKEVSFGMGDDGEGGKYTQTLKNWMKDIMYGGEDHPWGVVVPEEL